MLLLFSVRIAEWPPVWERELFIRFTVRVFRERLAVCMCASFPFVFEGEIWDLTVLVIDYCLSIYFANRSQAKP